MNLSKIEKAFIIVLVVGIIVAAGFFLFIVPAKEGIDKANKKLESLQSEEEALTAELAREATIDDEIKTAKESAEKLEGKFYPDLTTYEAVEIILAHLKTSNLTTLGIDATSLSTNNLDLEVFKEEPVVYDLKTYSQNARGTDENALLSGQFKDGGKVYTVVADSINKVTITDENGTEVEVSKYTETMQKAHKEALCHAAVANKTSQTVGVTSVSFDVKGKYADYLKFIDFIYDLDRATYMSSVTIPMTYQPSKDSEEGAEAEILEEIVNKDVIYPCEDDTEIEAQLDIMFFSVEQMEELETIDASGVQIVVNQ